jgi:hypothetical protein
MFGVLEHTISNALDPILGRLGRVFHILHHLCASISTHYTHGQRSLMTNATVY